MCNPPCLQDTDSTPCPLFAVELVEPPKAEVLAWTKGEPLPARQAFSTIWKDGKTHMVVVDVSAKTVVSHTLYTGSGKPLLSAADFAVSLRAIEGSSQMHLGHQP